ncbi:hypothetical protein [Natrinema thermotolerans]
MRLQSIKHAGAVLAIVGALVVAGPSAGFSVLETDRGVGVQTVADPDAYLGIESEGDVTGTALKADSGPLRVGTLTNNVNEPFTVQDVTIASIGDGSVDDGILAVASPNTGDTIDVGTTANVTVECAAKQTVNERDVVVRVDGVEGSTISVADPTFNATVDIQCGQGKFSGQVSFAASNVSSDGTTQTVSFDPTGLSSKGEATIDFSDPQDSGGVSYSSVTDADVTVQSGKGTASFDPNTAQLTYSSKSNEKNTVTIEIANLEVDGPTGESYQVTYADSDGREDGDIFEIT